MKPPSTFRIDVEIECGCGGRVGANQKGALTHTLPTCKAYDEIGPNTTTKTSELLARVQKKLDEALQN